MNTNTDKLPLNGVKTHPLSKHARDVLHALVGTWHTPNEINPGVIDRLQREDLILWKDLPSPYKKHKGKKIPHLKASAEGIKKLQELDAKKQ